MRTSRSNSSDTRSSFCSSASGSSASDQLPFPTKSVPSSPTKRRAAPESLRLQPLGIDPAELVGKVLTRIRRSPNHPNLTLDFADKTSYQIRVDGYDPVHRGVPKELETSPSFGRILAPGDVGPFTIAHCTLVSMTDKAFRLDAKRLSFGARREDFEDKWDQSHLGIAFKFKEETGPGSPMWHCVWATLAEHDQELGACVFRSYDDVYIDRLDQRPRKRTRR